MPRRQRDGFGNDLTTIVNRDIAARRKGAAWRKIREVRRRARDRHQPAAFRHGMTRARCKQALVYRDAPASG